ncbi:MAG TPA: hypothetical protein HPP87_10350 [Planctomycetes bacterium]|nr:hypothetical protein [Planctomycetota bacterium]HIJ71746.1 hypothetical protein [Planctomycetota bacterium]
MRFGKNEPVSQYESDTPQEDGFPLLRLLLEKIPLFALSVISSVVTFIVQKNAGAMKISQRWPISFRLANALHELSPGTRGRGFNKPQITNRCDVSHPTNHKPPKAMNLYKSTFFILPQAPQQT